MAASSPPLRASRARRGPSETPAQAPERPRASSSGAHALLAPASAHARLRPPSALEPRRPTPSWLRPSKLSFGSPRPSGSGFGPRPPGSGLRATWNLGGPRPPAPGTCELGRSKPYLRASQAHNSRHGSASRSSQRARAASSRARERLASFETQTAQDGFATLPRYSAELIPAMGLAAIAAHWYSNIAFSLALSVASSCF